MIEVGKYNALKILRETTVGLFLGDDEGEDVLLPNKYCPEEWEQDEEIHVFVYRDHEDRKVATTLVPKIFLHEFALLETVSVDEVGVFMDWGLEKHLMVPFREQRQDMEEGRWYVVYMDLDEKTDRVFASNKVDNYLNKVDLDVKKGDKVEVLILQKTDLGYNVIINNRFKGLIYHNEIFGYLRIGDKKIGWVKNIREDNKIDVSLQAAGYENANDANSRKILDILDDNDGYISINDKSSPEDIYKVTEMSKKSFKKAIGALYKEKKISFDDRGIKLLDE